MDTNYIKLRYIRQFYFKLVSSPYQASSVFLSKNWDGRIFVFTDYDLKYLYYPSDNILMREYVLPFYQSTAYDGNINFMSAFQKYINDPEFDFTLAVIAREWYNRDYTIRKDGQLFTVSQLAEKLIFEEFNLLDQFTFLANKHNIKIEL